MTINAKLRLAFLLVALLLLGSTAVQRWMTAHILIDKQLDQLETAAEIQKQQIDALVKNSEERLALVASRTRLRAKLNDYVEGVGAPEDTRAELERILRDAQLSISDFEAIVVTALDGRVIASTREGEAGRDAAKEIWYIKGKEGPSLDTFVLGEDGVPRCFLSTSLIWEDKPIGVVSIRCRADRLMGVAQARAGLGKTGETVIAQRNANGDALLLTPLRFDPKAALRRVVPASQTDAPLIQALSGKEVVLEDCVDYRGRRVLAATRHLPSGPIGIVVKMDRKEVFAPAVVIRNVIVCGALLMLAVLGLIFYGVIRSVIRPVQRLAGTAHQISTGDLDVRAEPGQKGEIGELSGAFNRMADRMTHAQRDLEEKVKARTAELEDSRQALRAGEERLALALEGTREGLWDWNISSGVVFFSERWLQILGYEEGEIEGSLETFQEHVHPDDREGVMKALTAHFEKKAIYDLEIRMRMKDGRHKWIRTRGEAVRDDEGKPVRMVGTHTNITARKLMEDQLRKSRAEFAELFDNAPVGYHVLDTDGRILTVNQTELDMLGYTQEEMIGHYIWEFVGDEKTVREALDAKLAGNLPPSRGLERDYLRKDGSRIPVSIDDAYLHDDEGNVTGIRSNLLDITERRKAQEKLNERSQALERSNRELQQFAYVASHDLQEPLRMVTSYLQLLKRRYGDKLDENADEFIGFAVDGSQRMHNLIDALLAYSRVGTRGKDPVETDCEEVFEAALSNLRLAIEECAAEVTHDPLPRVLSDDTQMIQLFQNLIGNALKFRGDKTPRVHVSAERDGDRFKFCVRDNGIGIDSAQAERIFLVFQRLHARDEYEGTGIGLAICQKIVERHGGKIWVESKAGEGAVFFFTLPVAPGS